MRLATAVAAAVLILTCSLHAADEPLAWIRLTDDASQEYEGVRYIWLGNKTIELTIDVAPADGRALDLFWGSKSDQRGAEVHINGKRLSHRAGGYNGFRWQRVKIPAGIRGENYRVRLAAASPKAAFISAVCLTNAAEAADHRLPRGKSHRISIKTSGTAGLPAAPADISAGASRLNGWMEKLKTPGLNDWQRAEVYGAQANEALKRCRKYVDGWLAHADPKTGLIPRNLRNRWWNGRDSGADNYAFMVLTTALTDREMYQGRMLDMLATETKLTSRVGALPADWDFGKQGYRHAKPDINRLIFDGSEYVKDGLMPITEWLGHTPWSKRMISIVDSILEHSPVNTPGGKIPSTNVEVNGEMMQVLSRLCFMADEKRYLDMACRIADYHLLGNRHPTRDATKLGLRDHNCELISGLTEVYAACHRLRKDKAREYRKPIAMMLDRILEVGVNEHGLMYDAVNPQTGKVLRKSIGDNWGYNYNGFYTVSVLDGIERYRKATTHAMSNLKPHYWKFAWQGWGSDGIADSVEGALNLFNREPEVPGVSEWIDANIARMLLIQKPDGIIEGWHGDGNYARTAILWVLMKQQGVTVQPWREDVRLGAVRDGDQIRLVLEADEPWQGKLIFDQPRHKTVMKMPLDYPRINQFPEWFTVAADGMYEVTVVDRTARVHRGKALTAGLEIRLDSAGEKRFVVRAVR